MKPVRDILVLGGGIVGWSAAAALRRRLAAVAVTVVPVEPPADALADRMPSTLPSIFGFHGDLGLSETDTILNAGSVLRMGTRFSGWNGEGASYVHAYGGYGSAVGGVPFHQAWLRAKLAGRAERFDAYSLAAASAEAQRVVPPGTEFGLGGGDIQPALRLDVARYRDMMHAFALHLGARERRGVPVDVSLRENGFVDAVRLEDGSSVGADLFVDCTGPAAWLRSRMDQRFEEWSRWLPCDRILFAEEPTVEEPPPLDDVEAVAAGWRWQAAGARVTSRGHVYSSAHAADGSEDAVPLRQGYRPEPWLRNCVAIGDAAVAVEPLENPNLHLAHSAIDRLVSMMPDRDCAPVELWDYNRQCAAEAERVRDFLVLHYAAANRPADTFWRDAAAAEPPASLAHTLALFRERGRLPFYEEETFSRDSWLAVFFGQDVMPRRVDPLADVLPPAQAEQALARMRQAIEAKAPRLPSQSAYLNHLSKQAAQ
ncbi:MAG TPA: tryptophan halogenase family protein [Allosphingosinicella sp.]|jgi:tryptophan halogenase